MKFVSMVLAAAVIVGIGAVASAEMKMGKHEQATTAPAGKQPINKACLVTDEPLDPTLTYEYQGKTIGFCCEDCIKAFKKNPEKYLKKLEKQQKQD
jgi:YHS domain-containing protein